MSDVQQRIDQLVKNNDILLFMKGSASFPMCGFSGRAIQILKACGVDPKAVTTVNVLEDDAIRQGIKDYSNWPTIPQLYVKGEFIGGCTSRASSSRCWAPRAELRPLPQGRLRAAFVFLASPQQPRHTGLYPIVRRARVVLE